MILQDIKKYLQSRKQASLGDIALHFDVEPEAIRGMLDFWVSKGKITVHRNDINCGGCSCSHKSESDVYAWNPQLGKISIDIQ